MDAHDPTNVNAVAGPSRLAYAAPPATTTSHAAAAMQQPTASPPPRGRADGAAPTTAARKDPVRRADGPVIVPTRVDPVDNVRVVPQHFENCQLDDLISLIASMLDRLIEHNDRIPLTSNSLTRFHSRAPPNITVRDYLLRIAKYTNVEPCCLLILLPYVDKACARITSFTISSLTVHRFIIAAISVGSKALSDAFCTNGRYARVGGISVVEMNLLEKEFCEALDWRLTTSGPVLAHYYTSLVRSHPSYRLSTAPAPSPPPPPPAYTKIPAPLPTTSISTATSTPPSPPKQSSKLRTHQQPPPEPHPSAMDVDTPPSALARSSTLSKHAAAVGSDPSSSSSSSSTIGGSTSSEPDPATNPEPSSYPTPSNGGEPPPPLFPPNLSRNIGSGTGSNLPSPARGAEHTPPPIEGQGTGAGARGGGGGSGGGGAASSSASGLRYLESVNLNGGEVTSPGGGGGGGTPNPYGGGVKRAHDRLADSSRSRSRERGTLAGAGVGVNGAGTEERARVGSPLAAVVHAGASSVRISTAGQEARLGKSPRLAYASPDRL
ncbi:hypothetical protein JCM8115_003793 [Rhodotorula mucilaginosa]